MVTDGLDVVAVGIDDERAAIAQPSHRAAAAKSRVL
jgi:hypothetical protein